MKQKATKKIEAKPAKKKETKKVKKKKPINVLITPRDINIFETLACGPMTISQIRDELASVKGEGTDLYEHDLREDTIRKRLNKLADSKYANRKQYCALDNKGVLTLYTLTALAAPYLLPRGYDVSHLRTTLPERFHIRHEMMVVEVLKSFRRNAANLGLGYKVQDEILLMSYNKGKKGMAYPDLHISLHLTDNGVKKDKHLALEIDNSTIEPNRVFEKARKVHDISGWIPIILCREAVRIDALKSIFAHELDKLIKINTGRIKEKVIQMSNRTLFASMYDFCAHGLFSTDFRNAYDEPRYILPRDFTGKAQA